MSKSWIDLGSDVNWREYGGLWGRAISETVWEIVEFFGAEQSAQIAGAKYWAKYTTHSLENPDLPAALQASDVHPGAPDSEQIRALSQYTSTWAETYFYRGNNAKKVLAAAQSGSVLVRDTSITVSASMRVS